MIRAWRAPLVTDMRVGFDRAPGEPPCEPAAWVPVDIDGDVEDAVIADDGRSMWRVDDDGWTDACLLVNGEVRHLWTTACVWEAEPPDVELSVADITELRRYAHGRIAFASEGLALLAAIALAKAVAQIGVEWAPPGTLFDSAEACVRTLRVEHYEACERLLRLVPSAPIGSAASHVFDAQSRTLQSAMRYYRTMCDGETRDTPPTMRDDILRIARNAAQAAKGDPSIDLGAVLRGVIPTQWVYERVASMQELP